MSVRRFTYVSIHADNPSPEVVSALFELAAAAIGARMSSVASIIPNELFDASKKAAVIDFLANAPAEAKLKQKALLDWARWVGVRIQARDYQKLAASAIDR